MLRIKSYGSVVNISLDREAAIKALRDSASRLKAVCPEVQEVRLFGSLARGDHTGTSDADILLILSQSPLNPVERLKRYLPFFDLALAVDVLPFTESEMAGSRVDKAGALHSLLEESVLLA